MLKVLQQLLTILPNFTTRLSAAQAATLTITGVTDDSRQVQPGNLFVAYRGVEADGHRYIPDAIKRGAAAVVCETEQGPAWPESTPTIQVRDGRAAFGWLCAAWHDFPSRHMTTIGVTGTDGKTTTANLIFNILKAAELKAGMISTVNAVIGTQVLETGLHTTTPDADEFQGYLAQMRDAGMTHSVLEITSHALAQHRVDGTAFAIAAITNITQDHLDLHGTQEAYRSAKGQLFSMARQHVLNADDPFSFFYLWQMSVEKRVIYTRQPDMAPNPNQSADGWVVATQVEHRPAAMQLRVATPIGELDIHTTLIGDFNVSNILAAISTAILLDIPAHAIQDGIAALQGIPGRMERIDAGQDYLAVVDFAHTPNSLDNCLRTLRTITPGRLIVVFGCAGERDAQKRPLMGRIAAEQADVVVLTAEDPRRESLDAIMDEVEAGARAIGSEARFTRVADRGQAIRLACSLARAGDTVAVCGKGHEQSMCFGTTEVPWDDRQEVRRVASSQ